jgi:hypothetical protein
MCGMNITLSLADDVVERAREVARQQGTSLNALVRQYVERLARGDDEEDLAEQFRALWAENRGHSGGRRFKREDAYEERLGRYAT